MSRILLFVVAMAVVFLPALPASADVTTEFANGVLTVNGDADGNDIVVACEGGNVRVNGAPLSGGEVACSAVESMTVRGGAGADHLTLADVFPADFPGLAEVSLLGEDGNDTLTGSAFGDRLDGGPGGDTLRSGDGADTLVTDGNGELLVGGSGKDTVVVSGDYGWTVSDDGIERTPATDETTMQGIERANVSGGGGDNWLFASGFSGPLVLDGGGGDDLLLGGPKGDLLLGKGGNDSLVGGDGNDVMKGSGGTDALEGGNGNDRLDGGTGTDRCVGGDGTDTLVSC